MISLSLAPQTGNAMIGCLGDKVETFLGYTDVGSTFVYGYLAMDIVQDGNFLAPAVFYFKTLSVIFFFSFIVSMLFYAGVMQACKSFKFHMTTLLS